MMWTVMRHLGILDSSWFMQPSAGRAFKEPALSGLQILPVWKSIEWLCCVRLWVPMLLRVPVLDFINWPISPICACLFWVFPLFCAATLQTPSPHPALESCGLLYQIEEFREFWDRRLPGAGRSWAREKNRQKDGQKAVGEELKKGLLPSGTFMSLFVWFSLWDLPAALKACCAWFKTMAIM